MRTMVNSSASHMAISSDASGLPSLGWKSASSVSSTTLSVSTSSASLVRDDISPRRAPEATEAGYSLAKLRRPRIAARRSSRSVALDKRLLSVLIVSVAVCLGGALASSTRIILVVGKLWCYDAAKGAMCAFLGQSGRKVFQKKEQLARKKRPEE